MSNKEELNRIKARLGRDEAQSRQVFRKAIKRLPWYSIYRFRNIMILATLISASIMSKPLYDMYWGIKRGIAYERERSRFLRQLDQEFDEKQNNSKTFRDEFRTWDKPEVGGAYIFGKLRS